MNYINKSTIRSSYIKKICIIIIVILVISVTFTSNFNSSRFKLVISNINPESNENVKLNIESPKYHGLDKKGREFSIVADNAISIDNNIIKLENINTHIDNLGKKYITAYANNGLYYSKDNIVNLNGNISILDDSGISINTENIFIDFIKSEIKTNDPIYISNNQIEFVAQNGLQTYEEANKIYFKGPIKLKIWNNNK